MIPGRMLPLEFSLVEDIFWSFPSLSSRAEEDCHC